jgi:hypothetical protein
MEQDFMSRGYLLPPGCKDLMDVLKLKAVTHLPLDLSQLSPEERARIIEALKLDINKDFAFKQPFLKKSAQLPPIVGQVVVSAEMTPSQLAPLLGQKVFRIVADVMELGFFIASNDPLSFEIISSVARKHGFLAIRAAS